MQYCQNIPSVFFNCLEILLPTSCRICLRPLRGTEICYRCRPTLPNLKDLATKNCWRCFSPLSLNAYSNECEACSIFPPLPNSMRFIWEYVGLTRDLIRTIKYRPSVSLAKFAGGILSEAVPQLFERTAWDLIIPVPSSHAMFRKRLFHPCYELARPVSRSLRIPLVHALHQNSKHAPQASLPHKDRIKRLRNLFNHSPRLKLTGKRILLVEDVITTGATIVAATSLLKQSGALEVDVVAIARTRVWSRFRKRLCELTQEEMKNSGCISD